MLGGSRMLCGFKVESLVAHDSDRAYFKMCKGHVCTPSRQKHASPLRMKKSKVLQHAL